MSVIDDAERANSPDARADHLLDQMSLDEQIGLLHGHMPRLMRDKPGHVQIAAGWVPGLARLGIPDLTETDASLGVSGAGRRDDAATALPCGLAQAASWNATLVEEAGAMIGAEARAKGFNVLLAGGVNIARDPRNGRNFEYLGEDPLLAGVLGGAAIKGIQSNNIISTIKHFAVNDQETGRMVMSANIGEAAMRESDLLAFQIGIEIGDPGSVMCAYNRINGTYACSNAYLLTDVLRTDWGWKGWVMSDWGAVHGVDAANAGLDQQSGQELDRQVFFGEPLKAAVAAGKVPAARVREMAQRILRELIDKGVMDNPVTPGAPDLARGAEVARRAAEAGIVLLKNEGDLLPLTGAKRIAVIGGRANVGVLSGGGSSQVTPRGSKRFDAARGSPDWSQGAYYHPDPPLSAIRSRAGDAEVIFDDGSNPARAANLAHSVDTVILFAEQWQTEALDRDLILPDGQDALIAAVAAANPRTIVVLQTGNPVLMPWLANVAAVIEAWYPGSEGGKAIAAVLFGDVNPSGRLPITFPASEAQLPHPKLPGFDLPLNSRGDPEPFDVDYHEGSDVGYRWFARTAAAPLFPFGFGLSYTGFQYASLHVEGGETATVSFDITNTGDRAGLETAQLYLQAAPGRTQQRLLGWAQVSLEPGETQRVTIAAHRRLLADWNTAAHAFQITGGDYHLMVGPDAATTALEGVAKVIAANLGP